MKRLLFKSAVAFMILGGSGFGTSQIEADFPLLRELRRDLAFVQSQLETLQNYLNEAESFVAEQQELIANLQAQLAAAESVEEAQAIANQISGIQALLPRIVGQISYWSILVPRYEAAVADLEEQIALLEASEDEDEGAGEV